MSDTTPSDAPTGYRMIRASASYDPVILVTPPDADPCSGSPARYFEYNSRKDGPGWNKEIFNEISTREAMFAFSGMADGWGFGPLPEQVFPSLEDALRFLTGPRVPRF